MKSFFVSFFLVLFVFSFISGSPQIKTEHREIKITPAKAVYGTPFDLTVTGLSALDSPDKGNSS